MLTLAKRVGNAVRLAEVVQVLMRHGFADLVQRAALHEGIPAKVLQSIHVLEAGPSRPETVGQRLRNVLMDLGPTFVKFGQILSTRPDVIGYSIAQDLSELQDRVAVLPFEDMERVIVSELGSSVASLFESFEQTPVAAASLSQVYKATLPGGKRVAVKVLRPNVERVIESDLRLMGTMAEWVAEHVKESAWFDPVGVVDEFARSIRRELDFSIEARVIERFRENFDGVSEIFVPRVYADVSSRRVLTMDWVDGVRLDALDQYDDRNCDPPKVARIGSQIVCRQVFEHHLFHADPHPGNIFITHDNQIAFLDYGMVGHVERTDAAAMADLLYAMFREDSAACVTAMLLLTTGDAEDRQALEHEAADFIAFEGQALISGGRVGEGIEKMIDILRRHHLRLAPRFSLLLKSLATIESVGHLLDPKMDMIPIIQPYVERLVATRYSPVRVVKEAQEGMAALLKLSRELPGELEQLTRMMRRGKLRFKLDYEGLDHLANVTDRASNRIAFGVIAGSIIVGSSMLFTRGAAFNRLGLVGFVIAGVLGLSLLISILRSKNY